MVIRLVPLWLSESFLHFPLYGLIKFGLGESTDYLESQLSPFKIADGTETPETHNHLLLLCATLKELQEYLASSGHSLHMTAVSHIPLHGVTDSLSPGEPMVKGGGGRIKLWHCFTSNGTAALVKIKGIIGRWKMVGKRGSAFQHDNDKWTKRCPWEKISSVCGMAQSKPSSEFHWNQSGQFFLLTI